MDRTDGQNYIDIGAGRRGFRDQAVDAGVPGTRVTAAFLNSLQEEILTVIENAGITPAAADWSQLDAAIRKVAAKTVNDYVIPLAQLNALPWLPVISLTQKKPPTKPVVGDLYVVPFDGTGEWSDKGGQIAEWTGQKWLFSNSHDGHGIGLPDGAIYIKINGVYTLLTNLFDKRYAQLASPPASTFYVIGPTGNDNNTGLKPTPEEGFATVQGAIDAISAKYITPKTITLKISAGTYDGVVINASFVPNWVLEGDIGNPEKVKFYATKIDGRVLRGLGVGPNTKVLARGITFSGYCEAVSLDQGNLTIDTCFAVMTGSPNAMGIACYSGKLSVYGNVKISGKGIAAFYNNRGSLALGYSDPSGQNKTSVTYDNCTCTVANFLCQAASSTNITAPVVTFWGQLNGRRFLSETNSILDVWSAGNYYLPGTVDGQTLTGGIYR